MLLKKLFQTILILFGVGILVCLLGFAIMMIGHVSLFGYSYISLSYQTSTTNNDFSVEGLTKLDIETSNIDVRIVKPSTNPSGNTGYYAFVVEMQGIVKSDVLDVKFKDAVKPQIVDGALVIRTVAPEGFFFRNNTVLEINLPQDKAIDEIKINTNSKEVNFGSSNFEVNKLDITAGKSFLNNPVTLGENLKINQELKINANYGRINVNSTLNGNVVVESLAGSIVINKDIGGNLTVKGSNPLVTVGTIPGNWRDRKDLNSSDLNSLKSVSIGGDLLIDKLEDGGNVKVSGTVNNVTISQSSIVEFWANKINCVLSCNDGSNNIRVFGSLGSGNPSGLSTINTGEGSLFINNSYCVLNITAQKGDVFIENANNKVTINSTNGSSTVHFNKDAAACEVNISNDNWNIEVTNIKGKAILNAKSGSVNAAFLSVSGQNEIYARRNVDVRVKDGSEFKLITSSNINSGSVEVNMPPVIYDNWTGSTTEGSWRVKSSLINTTNESISNILLLRISGNDKIVAKLVTEL